MPLLAEPKRKTKFGLDPRNTNWSNDDSKIGQRLLEKMGWEKGKGLGAKEDGIRDHIKATYKSDTRGFGCTLKDADAWIAHQDDFNDLLKQLNSQTTSQESSVKSEEERPPDGHKRYYGRFARGRVPTLRSTEDLNCIFGKRKHKSTSEPTTPDTKSARNSGDESDDKKHGITTVKSSSSVQEYFALKMAALKAKKENTQKADCLSENEVKDTNACDNENRVPAVYAAVQFMYDQKNDIIELDKTDDNKTDSNSQCPGEVSQVDLEINEKKLKKKKRKDRRNAEEIVQNSNEPNCSVALVDVEKLNAKDKHNESKVIRKNKKKHKVNETDHGDRKEAKNAKNDESNSVEVEILKRKSKQVDESTDERKHKRKKSDKNKDEVCIEEIKVENTVTNTKVKKSKTVVDGTNVDKKDKKKSKKRKYLDHVGESSNKDIEEGCSSELKKSKKKSKLKDVVCNKNLDGEKTISNSVSKEKKVKKNQSEKFKESNNGSKKINKISSDDVKSKEENMTTETESSENVKDTVTGSDSNAKTESTKVKRSKVRSGKSKKSKKNKSSHMSSMFPGSNLGDIEGYAMKIGY